MGAKLLLVDDDPKVASIVSAFLVKRGCSTQIATSVAEAKRLLAVETPDIAILDHDLPDGTGVQLLESIRASDPQVANILLTGHGTIDLAVKAIKLGAEHFLTKPVELKSLWVLVERVLETQRARRKESAHERALRRSKNDPFMGSSRLIQQLREMAHAVLPSDAPILILGPTGAGKGVLAQWFHDNGPRSTEAFVDLNCAGLSKELAESELFGHQKGSFTGAHSNKRGLLEIAHKGTAFLDEIGDLDQSVQPKLLKVLEDRTFRRIGETQNRQTDVRLISATLRDLGEMVRENAFRADLLFRINTVTLELPALKDRREDIPVIARHLLERVCQQQGRTAMTLTDEAEQLLQGYDWPGNIRELRNVIERATLFSSERVVGKSALRFDRWLSKESPPSSGGQRLSDIEKNHILHVLKSHQGQVETAANILGVPRSSLYAKLKKYGISASEI